MDCFMFTALFLGCENLEKLFYVGPTHQLHIIKEGFLTIDMMRLGSMKGTISVTGQGGSDVVKGID